MSLGRNSTSGQWRIEGGSLGHAPWALATTFSGHFRFEKDLFSSKMSFYAKNVKIREFFMVRPLAPNPLELPGAILYPPLHTVVFLNKYILQHTTVSDFGKKTCAFVRLRADDKY